MYILSTRPIDFSFGFGYGSISSATNRRPLSQNCSSGARKNGRQEVVLHMNNYYIWCKELPNTTRKAKLILPQVCSGNNGGFEMQPFDEKSKIEESIDCIKKMLHSIGDREIRVSAYDTAWVALIEDCTSSGLPQFPSSLEWIASNQLPDGSWGNENLFLVYDRLLCTIACVVALRTWNVHPNMIEKGLLFVRENISKLEDATGDEHMMTTLGFEILFPALIERARNLGIEGFPYDDLVIQKIYVARDQKLERISKGSRDEKSASSSSLLILEGLENIEWRNILKLQSPDGSFAGSPSTTAFVYMETKDENCLRCIKNIAEKFVGGGAPSLYPVDIFTRLWAVNRLQRLGISRFFQSEIEDCLSYIYRFWTEREFYNGRDSQYFDVNNISLGFRLLRLHGYNISPNEFINLKKGGRFCEEMVDSPSTILNLYRASQVLFPMEAILEEIKELAHKLLQERQPNNQIIPTGDEIKYGLETPWYASLPRLDARFFIEHHSVDEVGTDKSLYRLLDMKKDTYLELAKLDYNRCQEQHQMEWNHIQKWYEDCKLEEFGIRKKKILEAHFFAVASIFEAERSGERVAWVKSQILADILSTYYLNKQNNEFSAVFNTKNHVGAQGGEGLKSVERIIDVLFEALTQLKKNAQERCDDGDISDDLLHEAWGGWLKKLGEGTEEEGQETELIVRNINICGGHIFSKQVLSHQEYKTLSQLTNRICQHLMNRDNQKMIVMKIEKEMQLRCSWSCRTPPTA